MSDHDMSDTDRQAPSPAEIRLAQRREALAKARAAPRKAKPRTAEPRTAADAKVGVIAHPGPAERRNEPTREQYSPQATEVFTRRKRNEQAVGWADIPKHLKKPGWDYQWIAIRVLNEPVDGSDLRDYREGGWRPVPAKDMLYEMSETGAAPDSSIEAKGCRLYTRPMHLTLEARQEDDDYARQQQRDRTMAAASGKSAIRGEEGMPSGRGVRTVPVSIEIEGLAG